MATRRRCSPPEHSSFALSRAANGRRRRYVDRKRKEQIRETMSLLQELTAEERSWDAPGAEYERPRDIGRIPGLGLPPRGARSGYARLQ